MSRGGEGGPSYSRRLWHTAHDGSGVCAANRAAGRVITPRYPTPMRSGTPVALSETRDQVGADPPAAGGSWRTRGNDPNARNGCRTWHRHSAFETFDTGIRGDSYAVASYSCRITFCSGAVLAAWRGDELQRSDAPRYQSAHYNEHTFIAGRSGSATPPGSILAAWPEKATAIAPDRPVGC